jgi:two pore calcium channel protein 2
VLVTVAVYIPNEFDDARWIRYTACLRLLRLLQLGSAVQLPSMLRFLYLLVALDKVTLFYETFLAMLPPARRLLKTMFCIMFAFAAVGVTFFGGLVTILPDNPHFKTLSDMAFGVGDYWGINFNDMPSAMVLMVQILVVNNWMVFVEAYGAVAGGPAYALFIAFHFVGVIAGAHAALAA